MIAHRLAELESAEKVEDFFEQLGVPYDVHLVAVHRTRLLRLFGRAVSSLPESLLQQGEDTLRAAVRATLVRAYEALSDERAGRPAFAARVQLVQLARRGAG